MAIQYINETDIVRTTGRNKINSNFVDLDNSKAEKNLSNVDDNIILEKLKNVDGDGSGLDADLLDGFDSNDFEKVINKVSSWQTTPDDIHYPSEKLVKDSLDLKADDNEVVHLTGTETITGRKTFNNDVDINGDVNIDGNVNIKGNLNYVDTENLQVEDKVIILDKGGTNVDGSGLEVEENGSIVASLKYNKGDNRWNDGVDNLARVGEITDLDNNKANKDLSNVSNTDFLNKIKAVDGSGSGIDADLLDGKQASDFALSSHTHNWGDISKSGSKLSDIEDVQAYTGQAGKLLAVKNTEDGTEWVPVEAVSGTDELVKADSGDSTAGYLSDKVDGNTLEVDTTNHKIKVKDGVFATDSNVVHKSGDETISGVKQFTDRLEIVRADSDYKIIRFRNNNENTAWDISMRIDKSFEIRNTNDITSGHWDMRFHINPDNGNVGIGTDNPQSKLAVHGDIRISNTDAILLITSDTNKINGEIPYIYFNNKSDTTGQEDGRQLRLFTRNDGGHHTGIKIHDGNGGNRFIAFETNNTERVRIVNSGNVGIGTTNPSSKLTVDTGNSDQDGIITRNQNTGIGLINGNATPWIDFKGDYLSIGNNDNIGTRSSHGKQFIIYKDGDIETTTAGKGLILKGEDGNRYRLSVNSNGELELNSI